MPGMTYRCSSTSTPPKTAATSSRICRSAATWTHTWTDLDADHEWTVVEAAVPDGYTTISDVEGDSTEITNTHTPPTTPDQPHTGADVQQAAWIAVAILGAGLVLLIVAKTALRKRA